MQTLRIPLHIVFYKDENDWVAHCLEFDLCGHGREKSGALESLDKAIAIQVRESLDHNNPRNLFSPADSEYFRMYAAGRDIAKGELQFEFTKIDAHVILEDTQAREYDPEMDLVGA